MELAIIGLVVDETVRLWTRDGAYELRVEGHDQLRDLLGRGIVDREPMGPDGASTEMVLLDTSAPSISVSSHWQPEEGSPNLLAPAFAVRQATGAPTWSGAVAEELADFLTSAIERRRDADDVLWLFERDRSGTGWRSISCRWTDDAEVVISTNATTARRPVWNGASAVDGTSTLRFRDTVDDLARRSAMTMVLTVVEWPGAPLDLVLGWTPASAPPRGERSTMDAPPARGLGRHEIEAVHIPCEIGAPAARVVVDRRDVTRWYTYVSGGPVEAAHLVSADFDHHEMYVHSRYPTLDATMVNERATAILDHLDVPMALGQVRGDVLVVRAAGRGHHPRSVDADLARVLCD